MGREFDVRLRGIQALAGKTVRVCVDGEFFGAMRASGYGSPSLHRHGTPPPHGARSYASAPSPAALWRGLWVLCPAGEAWGSSP